MLRTERQSARMSKITNDGLPGLAQNAFYTCIHMATVGVKGLTARPSTKRRRTIEKN